MDGTEYVYSSEQEYDNIETSSEPVQGLATRVYKEFERMIAKYDQDSVQDLMPLVVTMLDTLDRSIKDKNESLVEVELLEEDKKQLKSQYERERQMKRQAEQRLMESEDTVETLTRDLKESNDKYDILTRQMDTKVKSHADQVERLLDREAELKKEYLDLHQRHSEMIRSYVEHIEKTKTFQQYITPTPSPYSPVVHKKKTEFTTDLISSTPETPHTQSIEMTPVQDHSEISEKKEQTERSSPNPFHLEQEMAMATTPKNDDPTIGNTVSLKEDFLSDSTSVESSSSATDSALALGNEFEQNILNIGSSVSMATPDSSNEGSSISIKAPTSLAPHGYGVENEGFENIVITHDDSLFAEMSGKDLCDVDDGADLLGMGKELENLILENTKLMATKNALDVVKDDLIHQVDQLTNQLTILQEDLDRSYQAKDLLSKRAAELEAQLKEAEKKAQSVASSPLSTTSKTDDEEVVPMSQRKRFTRVEMARVLMERNQYKERLMELQEAVRWTEMLRASRDHPAEAEAVTQHKAKSKSSFSQFFSRLFGPSTSNNSSPSHHRRQATAHEEMRMRHSKSDSFSSPVQSVPGK